METSDNIAAKLTAALQQKKKLEAEIEEFSSQEWQRFVNMIRLQDDFTEATLDREFGSCIHAYLDRQEQSGFTLYHFAAVNTCKTGDVLIPWLLKQRQADSYDPVAKGYPNNPVIALALKHRNWKVLLEFYRLVKSPSEEYTAILLFSMAQDFPTSREQFLAVLQHSGRWNITYQKSTLLQYGCYVNNTELIDFLLEQQVGLAKLTDPTVEVQGEQELLAIQKATLQGDYSKLHTHSKSAVLLACEAGSLLLLKSIFKHCLNFPIVTEVTLNYTYIDFKMRRRTNGKPREDGRDIVKAKSSVQLSAMDAAAFKQHWHCIPILLSQQNIDKSCESLKNLMGKYPEVFAEQTDPLLLLVQGAALEYFYKTRNELFGADRKESVNVLLVELTKLNGVIEDIFGKLEGFFLQNQKGAKQESFQNLLMQAMLKNQDFCVAKKINPQTLSSILNPEDQYLKFCEQLNTTKNTLDLESFVKM